MKSLQAKHRLSSCLLFVFSLTLLFPLSSLQAGEVLNQRTGNLYDDLQKAINQARSGDILELNGEFEITAIPPDLPQPFTIQDKSLTLKGSSMRDTKIDGNNLAQVLTINGANSNTEVILKDLTIRNGSTVEAGGGIFCIAADLELNRVKVTKNDASLAGGGIAIINGRLKIKDSIISENITEDSGGGIGSFNANVELDGVDISENTALEGGGGISHAFKKLTMTNSSIINNLTQGDGGGLITGSTTTTTVISCLFEDNDADRGGGIFNSGSLVISSPRFKEKSKIKANSSLGDGGGLFNDVGGFIEISNTSFRQNTAIGGTGGAIFNNDPNPENVTLDSKTTVINNNSEPQLVNVNEI